MLVLSAGAALANIPAVAAPIPRTAAGIIANNFFIIFILRFIMIADIIDFNYNTIENLKSIQKF